jgi:hypothetical protein
MLMLSGMIRARQSMTTNSKVVSIALGILACSVSAAEPHADQARAASDIIIPRVEYLGGSAPKILQQLQRMSEQRDPARRGVRIIVDDALPASATQKALTFTMNDTSVLNIARHVANVAGLEVAAKKDGIYIHAPR